MYANNSFSRRRAGGWAERRRRFRKFFEKERPQAVKEDKPKKGEENAR